MTSTAPGIAVVTGAGIGKAIALRLADDGFDVAVNDIAQNAENLAAVVDAIKSKGRASSAHIADVSVDEQVKAMVEAVVAAHGGIDVMVANAGVIKWATVLDATVEDWDRIMAVNARGAFLCYKYAGLQMIQQGRGGRLIAASSVAGKQSSPFLSAYCASKFAVRGLTQAAALEFGPHNITVNAYAPGTIDTDMLEYLNISHAATTNSTPGTLLQTFKDNVPLKRLGTTTDIANLVSFVASKESGFITGQSLSVNGGMYFD
ncbi:hypothetical protein C8J57DRAFT_1510303 [Mycena rebaudengoi]|nr:hypothetical protein C8J57DRAFT_1510303 [Mycena rebaudengoi]